MTKPDLVITPFPQPDLSRLSHAEKVVLSSIWNCPSLHAVDRDGSAYANVLVYLFSAVGNGFLWHEGQLVRITHPYLEIRENDGFIFRNYDYDTIVTGSETELKTSYEIMESLLSSSVYNALLAINLNNAQSYLAAQVDLINTKERAVRENILSYLDDYALIFTDPLYPMSSYSLLATVPDDITEDWARQAKLAIEIIFAAQNGSHDCLVSAWQIAQQAKMKLTELGHYS